MFSLTLEQNVHFHSFFEYSDYCSADIAEQREISVLNVEELNFFQVLQ